GRPISTVDSPPGRPLASNSKNYNHTRPFTNPGQPYPSCYKVYSPPQPADSVMNPWRGTIRDLCQTANIDPKPVIDTLVDKIRKELRENPRHNAIFRKFD